MDVKEVIALAFVIILIIILTISQDIGEKDNSPKEKQDIEHYFYFDIEEMDPETRVKFINNLFNSGYKTIFIIDNGRTMKIKYNDDEKEGEENNDSNF